MTEQTRQAAWSRSAAAPTKCVGLMAFAEIQRKHTKQFYNLDDVTCVQNQNHLALNLGLWVRTRVEHRDQGRFGAASDIDWKWQETSLFCLNR